MCVCLWTWAGDGLCLEFFACVCVFFFSSVNAKKGEGTKTHLKKICACARVRGEERECPRFLHGAPPPPSFQPSANLSGGRSSSGGGGGCGDIWEQF